MIPPTMSTAEALATRGFGHRKPTEEDVAWGRERGGGAAAEVYRRMIFDAATGERVGLMNCFEANDWIRAGCPMSRLVPPSAEGRVTAPWESDPWWRATHGKRAREEWARTKWRLLTGPSRKSLRLVAEGRGMLANGNSLNHLVKLGLVARPFDLTEAGRAVIDEGGRR